MLEPGQTETVQLRDEGRLGVRCLLRQQARAPALQLILFLYIPASYRYHVATRFAFVKSPVQELLNELEELLCEMANRSLPQRIARKFEAFRELLSIITSAIFEFYNSV